MKKVSVLLLHFQQLFRPCDLLSDPWHFHRLTDYADEHLVTPTSHWLDSLALQLAPSNYHRAAYLHRTRFRNTHTHIHALCRKSELAWNGWNT